MIIKVNFLLDVYCNIINSVRVVLIMTFTIITFYKFVELIDLEILQEKILNFCNDLCIKGTILLAHEGINATIAGTEDAIIKFKEFIMEIDEFFDLSFKTSYAELNPFQKMKVRLKSEIVKMAVSNLKVDAQKNYVHANEWDNLISDEDTILIDARNTYETTFGKFENAIVPDIENFHEFPQWFQNFIKNKSDIKNKKIAMYCTGGIRCEKSVSYVKSMGFEQVFHLKDGIIGYLAQNDEKKMWQDECFMFDDRVAVTKKLEPSKILRCNFCSNKVDFYGKFTNITKGKVLCKDCQD